jgi:hypothetical protein
VAVPAPLFVADTYLGRERGRGNYRPKRFNDRDSRRRGGRFNDRGNNRDNNDRGNNDRGRDIGNSRSGNNGNNSNPLPSAILPSGNQLPSGAAPGGVLPLPAGAGNGLRPLPGSPQLINANANNGNPKSLNPEIIIGDKIVRNSNSDLDDTVHTYFMMHFCNALEFHDVFLQCAGLNFNSYR